MAEKVRWVYKCPKCGREAAMEKPGTYYCKVCGPAHIMKFVGKTTVKELAAVPAEPMEFIRANAWMYGVWSTLELDRTLTSTQKNVLWQDFVAAWNRRGLLTNEEAALAMKARFGSSSSSPIEGNPPIKEGDCVIALKGMYAGKVGRVTRVEERPSFLGMRSGPKYLIEVYHGWDKYFGKPIYETYTLGEVKKVPQEQCEKL